MKAVVQRVSYASVRIAGKIHGTIEQGIVVLMGITDSDNSETIRWMVNKLINLRIFADENDKMNLSVKDIDGGILLIPNFTVYGDIRNGFRPSYSKSASPEIAEPLFDELLNLLKSFYPKVSSGIFGAMMEVELLNNGPVTVIIEK